MVARCSSSLEPKWAKRPLLLMPRLPASRCRETASRPSALPTLAAWTRIACRVRMPRSRRRSLDCNAGAAPGFALITDGGLILARPFDYYSGCTTDRAICLGEGGQAEMVMIEASNAGRPGLATLEASDGDALTRLFYRLSSESVYRRFFNPLSRPDELRAVVTRLDHRHNEAVAAVEGGEVVGLAQYSRGAGSSVADLAIVVADGWQRQGLGTRLVAALAERATAEGIDSFAV